MDRHHFIFSSPCTLTHPPLYRTIETVKITLMGELQRILSFAEFQVFGDSFGFDVEFGKLFNLPKLDINRIAFVQDSFSGNTAQSEFTDLALIKRPTEAISVSCDCCFAVTNVPCLQC